MTIAISPNELLIMRQSLAKFLPAGTQIWIYGSRARGTRIWRGSDLDLMLKADTKLSPGMLDDLFEDLAESDLPYLVDLHDWHRTDPDFLARKQPDMVKLPLEMASSP